MVNTIKTILLVDDEARLLNSMEQRLSLMGFNVIKASSGTKAIELAEQNHVNLAIVDLKMPDMDGLLTITRLKEIQPEIETVLLTGYGNKNIQQESQTLGSEYFEKDSMTDLWDLIKQYKNSGDIVIIKPGSTEDYLQNQGDMPGENIDSSGRSMENFPKIIGETPSMQDFRKNILRLSELDCNIIIQGETGTGKELAARAIHASSHRKDQRFLAFNCGCFSDDFHFHKLLNSFEDSYSQNSENFIKTARGFTGTILLDHFEIIPNQTQQEIIEILNARNSKLPASDNNPKTDIRFIVATHQDLKKRIEEEKINEQLYHGLNAISLMVPPLRERRDDILPLCRYFLSKLNKEFKKNIEFISKEVLSILISYPFPGNVRELKHIIERSVILSNTSTIELHHLPERFKQTEPILSSIENQQVLTLEKIEHKHILTVLEIAKGNKSKTAELLGISRGALWRKLKLINS